MKSLAVQGILRGATKYLETLIETHPFQENEDLLLHS